MRRIIRSSKILLAGKLPKATLHRCDEVQTSDSDAAAAAIKKRDVEMCPYADVTAQVELPVTVISACD